MKTYVNTKLYSQVFRYSVWISKTRNIYGSETDKWIKKSWYIHTKEYYMEIKNWNINVHNIKISNNYTMWEKKKIYIYIYMIPYIYISRKWQLIYHDNNRSLVTWGWSCMRINWKKDIIKGVKKTFMGNVLFLILIVVIVLWFNTEVKTWKYLCFIPFQFIKSILEHSIGNIVWLHIRKY